MSTTMATANATLRGYRISAVSRRNDTSVVTIRTPDYRIVAEYTVDEDNPKEAIRQVVRNKGRAALEQVPGYLSVADDIDHINAQWN